MLLLIFYTRIDYSTYDVITLYIMECERINGYKLIGGNQYIGENW